MFAHGVIYTYFVCICQVGIICLQYKIYQIDLESVQSVVCKIVELF